MRLGILSDTHDDLARMQQALRLLQDRGSRALVHCGDLATPPIVEALAVLPNWFVFGNHDSDMVPQLEAAAKTAGVTCLGWGGVIELSGRKIGVAHGHLTTDIERVLAEGAEFLLTGHAHYPFERPRGSARQICPGALFCADEFTVAMLDLETGAVEWLPVR